MDCIDLERSAEEPIVPKLIAANDNIPFAPRRPRRRVALVRR